MLGYFPLLLALGQGEEGKVFQYIHIFADIFWEVLINQRCFMWGSRMMSTNNVHALILQTREYGPFHDLCHIVSCQRSVTFFHEPEIITLTMTWSGCANMGDALLYNQHRSYSYRWLIRGVYLMSTTHSCGMDNSTEEQQNPMSLYGVLWRFVWKLKVSPIGSPTGVQGSC